jgi:hypothetical protein
LGRLEARRDKPCSSCDSAAAVGLASPAAAPVLLLPVPLLLVIGAAAGAEPLRGQHQTGMAAR